MRVLLSLLNLLNLFTMASSFSSILGSVAPVVGGVSDLVNGILQGGQNAKNRRFALDMWNRQNAYNAPAAQMQRLKDAGLNPNMIYGNGEASAGNAGPVSMPAGRAVSIGDPVGRYAQIRNAMSQTSNIDKMNQVYDSQIALNAANAVKATSQTKGFDIHNAFAQQTLADMIATVKANLTNTTAKGAVLQETASKIAADINFTNKRVGLIPVQADAIRAGIDNVRSQISLRAMQGKAISLKNVEQAAKDWFWNQHINPNASWVNQFVQAAVGILGGYNGISAGAGRFSRFLQDPLKNDSGAKMRSLDKDVPYSGHHFNFPSNFHVNAKNF